MGASVTYIEGVVIYPPPYALPSIVGVHRGTTDDEALRKGGSLVRDRLPVELGTIFLVGAVRLRILVVTSEEGEGDKCADKSVCTLGLELEGAVLGCKLLDGLVLNFEVRREL